MAVFKTRTLAVAVLLAPLSGANSPAIAQAASGFAPQQMLDMLAKPTLAGSRMGLPAEFPLLYKNWTEAQKGTGQQIVVQRCGLMYALEGDNPNVHLLPETMPSKEAAELAMDVCVPSKMPADWPERQKSLDNARRLITKANSQGATLHLPENLKETK